MTQEEREEIEVLKEKVRLLKEWVELKEKLESFKPDPAPHYIPYPVYPHPSPWYRPWNPQ